jgi:hypothetical protein
MGHVSQPKRLWEATMPRLTASAFTVIATLIAAPVLAQEAAPGASVPSAGPAAPGVTAGRLQKTDGGWRSSRIVGATVYNDSNQSIGTIDDLIVGQDGKIATAVLSVGGFLGIGSKLVRVPYDQLRFEERAPSETPANTPVGVAPAPAVPGTPAPPPGSTGRAPSATAPAMTAMAPDVRTTRIVLPGASKDSLTSMPNFDYGT